MLRLVSYLAAVLLLLVSTGQLRAAEATVEQLIDDLQKLDHPDYGCSISPKSETEFLPYPGSGRLGFLLLFSKGRAQSATLTSIIARGSDAIPALIKHIDDPRPINAERAKGTEWTAFEDEYDFNRRTAKVAPLNVNLINSKAESEDHAITVGDMCFVALGQIVNRSFGGIRYQTLGGCIVSSPSYSKNLKAAIINEWGTLTREQHLESLRSDFLNPDHSDRRTGAYRRLCFYFPGAVESLVIDELKTPAYDWSIVRDFCTKQLYAADDAKTRRDLFQKFVSKHGRAYAAGIQDILFSDLKREEGNDGSTDAKQARMLLNEFFEFPVDVKSQDAPPLAYATTNDRSEFIAALVHDESKLIGERVRDIYLAADRQDIELLAACMRSLANRGYAPLLLDELSKIDVVAPKSNHYIADLLQAIATSREPQVRDKLLKMVCTTRHAVYFAAMLPAIDPKDTEIVLQAARGLLNTPADDAAPGREHLRAMIMFRYGKDALNTPTTNHKAPQ